MTLLTLYACGTPDVGDDLDGDGSPSGVDCDDRDASKYPGAPEYCRDGERNDCDRTEAETRAFCALWRDVSAETATAMITGVDGGDQAGTALSAVPDLDGDGVGELLVGAPGNGSAGGGYVLSGATRGLGDMGQAWLAIDGSERNDAAGTAVAAGDLDDDGAPNLAFGAPGGDSVYLLGGVAAGEASLDDADVVRFPDSSAAGSALAVGDLDGDGVADLVVGAPDYELDDEAVGAVWFIAGPISRNQTYDEADPHVYGVPGAELGAAVAFVGDIDGDGVGDTAIGAPSGDGDGAVALIFGVPSGVLAFADADVVLAGTYESQAGHALGGGGDVDGDGLDDLVIGAPNDEDFGAAWLVTTPASGALDAVAAAQLTGVRAHDEAGWAVAILGDLDADGNADIAVGAPEWGFASGAVYAVFGPVKGSFDLTDSDIVITTAYDGSRLGDALTGLGDTDGDNRADFALGAGAHSSPEDEVGIVWMFQAAPI